jgi:Cu-Zn family superoxide dismutase
MQSKGIDMKRILPSILAVLSLAFFTACGGGSDHDDHGHGDGEHNAFAEVSKAICVLTPTNNQDLPGVNGTVTFTQTKSGVLVVAEVSGLTPNGKHGFHVHQWGDISVADGTGTGGHYDPTGDAEHGLPSVHDHDGEAHAMTGGHAGDFGNLEADADGNATYSKTFEDLSLTGHNAVLGRAIIVHIKEDDGGQPTGNAGARVAQGVIGIANPE